MVGVGFFHADEWMEDDKAGCHYLLCERALASVGNG